MARFIDSEYYQTSYLERFDYPRGPLTTLPEVFKTSPGICETLGVQYLGVKKPEQLGGVRRAIEWLNENPGNRELVERKWGDPQLEIPHPANSYWRTCWEYIGREAHLAAIREEILGIGVTFPPESRAGVQDIFLTTLPQFYWLMENKSGWELNTLSKDPSEKEIRCWTDAADRVVAWLYQYYWHRLCIRAMEVYKGGKLEIWR